MNINKQKNKIFKSIIIIPIFFTLILPLVVAAQFNAGQSVDNTNLPTSNQDNNGLVPCNNTGVESVDPTTKKTTMTIAKPCDWDALLELVNNVVHFILFDMLVPIAAIMFCYCGFLMLTSGGEPAKKTQAKKIFSNVVWGLIIAIAAWLIIETLLTVLGYNGSWIGF